MQASTQNDAGVLPACIAKDATRNISEFLFMYTALPGGRRVWLGYAVQGFGASARQAQVPPLRQTRMGLGLPVFLERG